MSQYDEDRVIALLRDAVPAVPEGPDRMTAIRHRAGRQRAMLWTQSIGAMASVLLVVGVAAAVAGPGDGGSVHPVDRPLAALEDALAHERSVRFEASVEPAGDVRTSSGDTLTAEQLRKELDSRVTGAATADGDFQVDGDLSMAVLLGEADAGHDMHLRMVDGTFYRSVLPYDAAPENATWVRDDTVTNEGSRADVLRALRMVAAIAEDVHYVRNTTVRDTEVAEYELTVPERYTHTEDIVVTFDLDAKDRLRRASARVALPDTFLGGAVVDEEFSSSVSVGTYGATATLAPATPVPTRAPLATMAPVAEPSFQSPPPERFVDPVVVRFEVELFGYGDDVHITAPPANETVDQSSLDGLITNGRGSGYGSYATPIMVTPTPVMATMHVPVPTMSPAP